MILRSYQQSMAEAPEILPVQILLSIVRCPNATLMGSVYLIFLWSAQGCLRLVFAAACRRFLRSNLFSLVCQVGIGPLNLFRKRFQCSQNARL